MRPKLLQMRLRLRHNPIKKPLDLFGILLPRRIIVEHTTRIPQYIELWLIRPIQRRYRTPNLITHVGLLLEWVLHHHEIEDFRGLALEVLDEFFAGFDPELPVVLPEILGHLLEVQGEVVGVVDFGVGFGEVAAEVPAEGLAAEAVEDLGQPPAH